MNKVVIIFASIILLTLSSFVIFWAANPKVEEETQSSQGIRLIGNAIFYNSENSEVPNKIKVGDLMLGEREQIYRINEIRKTNRDAIYVVVSWKYITAYKTFTEYQSEPYTNYKTFELNSFAYNKSVISNEELIKFYTKNTEWLQQRQELTKIKYSAGVMGAVSPTANAEKQLHPIVEDTEVTLTSPSVAPRTYLQSADNAVQAIPSTEVAAPSDMDKNSQAELKDIIQNVQNTVDAAPTKTK